MIKGIIFDMDNVLVKTIHIGYEIATKRLRQHNITLTKEDETNLAGYSWKEFLEYIYRTRKIKPIDGLLEEMITEYSILLPKKVELFQGVQQVLHKLHQKYPLALASGSSKKSINTNLQKFDLTNYFKFKISAEEVDRGKPAPDLYLAACQNLKLDPKDCVGIEDSILGVESVKSAGLKCIGITHTVPKQKLSQADVVISSLDQIPSAISSLETI